MLKPNFVSMQDSLVNSFLSNFVLKMTSNLNSFFQPPMIPIYPMVSKDLTFIHLGNKTKVDNMINFEKLRMLAKEIRGLFTFCTVCLHYIFIIRYK